MKPKQYEIDAITHFLDYKVVPEKESSSGDMYWQLSNGIRLYVERSLQSVTITTMNSESSAPKYSLLNIFLKTTHDIESKNILECLQEHLEAFKIRVNTTSDVLTMLRNRRVYDAIVNQQDKLIQQLYPLLQKPLYFKKVHNEVRIISDKSDYLGAIVCDLTRSDAELLELFTPIVQKANEKHIHYLIEERERIDSLLKSYGIVQ